MNDILHDTREIKSIWFEDETEWRVGKAGITAIKAYAENGQMEGVPWLAVYAKGVIQCRVNAAKIAGLAY